MVPSHAYRPLALGCQHMPMQRRGDSIEPSMPNQTPPQDTLPRTLAVAGLPRCVRRVLEHALTLVSDKPDHSLNTLLNEFEQELFRLADLARNPGSESGYMQTLRTFRMNRADLIPHFMLELGPAWPACAGSPTSLMPQHRPPPLSTRCGWSRIRCSTKRACCARSQRARRGGAIWPCTCWQWFGVLAGSPALDAERIPLGPQAICRCMRNAGRALQIDHDARLLLYRLFDRYVMSGFARILEKLDTMLADDGILPGLTYVPLRTGPTTQGDAASAQDSAPRRGRDDGQATAPEAGPRSGSHGRTAPRRATAGERAGASRASADNMQPHMAWMGEAPTTDEHGAEAEAYAVLQQLMAGRRALIGKLRPIRRSTTESQLNSVDLDRALGLLQSQPASPTGSPRNLTDIKQTLLAQVRHQRGRHATLSQHDEDTFELLHMLYGQLEGEIRPSAPATALVRRLQLPLLRIALQDLGLFARNDHPARQLLNIVAESAARWLDAEDFDPQVLAPLQQAVNRVVDEYQGDSSVFKASNRQVQAAMQTHAHKAEQRCPGRPRGPVPGRSGPEPGRLSRRGSQRDRAAPDQQHRRGRGRSRVAHRARDEGQGQGTAR